MSKGRGFPRLELSTLKLKCTVTYPRTKRHRVEQCQHPGPWKILEKMWLTTYNTMCYYGYTGKPGGHYNPIRGIIPYIRGWALCRSTNRHTTRSTTNKSISVWACMCRRIKPMICASVQKITIWVLTNSYWRPFFTHTIWIYYPGSVWGGFSALALEYI